MDTHAKRLEVEIEQDWIGEAETMPSIQFPPGWLVKVIPPFSDAVIRFRVKLPSGLEKSVFFDSRGSLDPHHEIPFWEVSPVAGKWGRCGKYDIDALLEMIAYEDENGE
jgi:hypothetical protein